MSKVNRYLKMLFSFLVVLIFTSSPLLASATSKNNDGLIKQTKEFYVNDYADVLDDDLKNYIIDVNTNFEKTTEKPQVVVSTVETLNDMSIDDYAYKLFEKFKIGNKDYDNGVLVLLAPNERKIRIEVGYGLEGCITDTKAGEMLDATLDKLSNGEYSYSIRQIFDNVCNEISKEYSYDESIFTPDSGLIIDFEGMRRERNKQALKDLMLIAVIISLFVIDMVFNEGNITYVLITIMDSVVGGSSSGRGSSGGGGRSGGGGASRGF